MKDSASRTSARLGLAALLLATLALDQWTKWLARAHFGLPGGEPDYFKVKQVIGEWLQLRLIYNTGAAFGMKPQQLVPGLSPTLFYLIFSAIAIGFLVYLYRRVPRGDNWQKAGITLILSGAFGNLIDRVRFAKVTDFIDVGVPGYAWRWPTFNVADSCVCIGVAMLIFATGSTRGKSSAAGAEADADPAQGAGKDGPADAPEGHGAPGAAAARPPAPGSPFPDPNP